MVPLCGFGQMGLCCTACSQGPCRINPFDPSPGTVCGRDRDGIVAAAFLRTIVDGVVAQASLTGAQAQVAPSVFAGLSGTNEGGTDAARLLRGAIEVAEAGLAALSFGSGGGSTLGEVQVGLGTIQPDRINILLLGAIPAARAQSIAAELATDERVNLVGAAGGEAVGVDVAASYGSQEALLAAGGVDGVVAGGFCVSPGLLALAGREGIPVAEAARFDATALLHRAAARFRSNSGRGLSAAFPASRAITGFSASTFAHLSDVRWDTLVEVRIGGVALMGGCNNVKANQDEATLRLATEFLQNDVLVVACGCAAVGLARGGFMDPARMESLAGRRLREFLSALSQASGVAVPAVMGAGSCWETPAALELAVLFRERLRLPMAAAMPELSRPAGWSSALALAARGVPTYVGPALPLDGGLESVATLNQLLAIRGGALYGPGQLPDPESVVKLVVRRSSLMG